uniref:Uncharacterized protein n=1 Tax=Strombidinopsis acuminata TaxID=141414 RepID=A0A7S3SPH8_9SPIT|mmetsp:Transcript_39243/g.53315  ORF Transcript_39243/g.53315 Transcript_39243/m.53315 type:complete len:275 (+) Transcript_39243:77-901(+)
MARARSRDRRDKFMDDEPEELSEPESDEEPDGICGWLCCRAIAHFEVPGLEEHRHAVLQLIMFLSLAGVVLTIIGFWGAFAGPGTGLRRFHWMEFEVAGGARGIAGVRVACTKEGQALSEMTWEKGRYSYDGLKCQKFGDMNCTNAFEESACTACKEATHATTVPATIATITYLLFASNTHKRYTGHDANKVKVMSCFSALFGGTNFGSTLLAYWRSCVVNAAKASVDGTGTTHMGTGLKCIAAATVLKLICGVLHLALPVEHGHHDEEEDFER